MSILLGTVFLASLLGSLHCVGMCGPFALLAANDPQQRSSATLPTLAYSGGRLITYSMVGAIFGSLGMALNRGASFTSWQQSATAVAGVLMIVVGVVSIARLLGMKIWVTNIFSPFQRILSRVFKMSKTMTPFWRALAIGAVTSLMPCGWLYTFAITAAGTGSPAWGTVLMATFWLGTVPIMAALMLGVNRIGTAFQKQLPFAMAGLVTIIGIYTIVYRAPIALTTQTVEVTSAEELAHGLNEKDHESLPCCASGGETDR